MSRGEQRRHFEENGLERSLVRVNAHSSNFHVVRRLDFPGARPREWLVRSVWKWKDEKKEEMMLSCETLDNTEEYPANLSYSKVKFASMWVFKKLDQVGRADQTLVTVTMRVDMGGNIQQIAARRLGVRQLIGVSLMRRQFDKSLEVDREVRAENMKMISDHDDAYDRYERVCLFEGEQQFAVFKGMKAKSLKMASPQTRAEIAFEKKNSHAWGRATTTVRASPEEVMASLWDATRRSTRKDDDLEKSVEERVNRHNILVYNKKRFPKIVADRDFLGRAVWRERGEGFVLVTSPEESDARPITDDVGKRRGSRRRSSVESAVRGKFPSAMRIKRKNDKETTLEYVIHPDAGGLVPSFIMTRYLGSSLSYVTEIQEYFLALRGLDEWDADDARAVGEVVCIATMEEQHPEMGENKESVRMRALFKQFKGLEEIAEKCVRERRHHQTRYLLLALALFSTNQCSCALTSTRASESPYQNTPIKHAAPLSTPTYELRPRGARSRVCGAHLLTITLAGTSSSSR